jgi:hypothetical protein
VVVFTALIRRGRLSKDGSGQNSEKEIYKIPDAKAGGLNKKTKPHFD